jgi:hypothetical protein
MDVEKDLTKCMRGGRIIYKSVLIYSQSGKKKEVWV